MSAAVCLYALGSTVLASSEASLPEDIINEEPTLDASSSDIVLPTATVQPSTGTDAVTRPIKGDVNGDNTVDLKDVTKLFQYVNGQSSSLDETVADINGDGSIDLKDVTRLFQYVNGQISVL
jgi:hypothetical protein